MMTEEQITAPAEEEKLLRLDGTPIDVEVSGTPYMYNGRPAVQVIVRDIAVRKSAERRLRESEERDRSLLKQSKEGVFIFDPESGSVQETNPFFLKLLGYSEEEMKNLTIYDLVIDEETHHRGQHPACRGRRIDCDSGKAVSEKRRQRAGRRSASFVDNASRCARDPGQPDGHERTDRAELFSPRCIAFPK